MADEIVIFSTFFTIALLFYSIGIWSQYYYGKPGWQHVSLFWSGVIADSIATERVFNMVGYLQISFHSITGMLGLLMMGVHATWATVAVLRGKESELKRFHRLSLFVWSFWLISYTTGAMMGLQRI